MKLPTYKQAYAGLSDERKASQTEAEFTAEAKAWNAKQAAKKSNTTPTAEVVAKSTNKAPKAIKPPTEISNKVKKAGLQTAAPGASGNVDKSHGHKTGTNQKGNTTTGKNREGKSDTLIESQGRTKGGSTIKVKDYATNREVDQTPSPDISKVKRKDQKAEMKGMNRQERKNYRDLQDTKKDMRKQSSKDAKASSKGKSRKQTRKDNKDAEINKKLLADADKKANTQKVMDDVEKDVKSSAMKNMKTGKYNHSFAKKKYKK